MYGYLFFPIFLSLRHCIFPALFLFTFTDRWQSSLTNLLSLLIYIIDLHVQSPAYLSIRWHDSCCSKHGFQNPSIFLSFGTSKENVCMEYIYTRVFKEVHGMTIKSVKKITMIRKKSVWQNILECCTILLHLQKDNPSTWISWGHRISLGSSLTPV